MHKPGTVSLLGCVLGDSVKGGQRGFVSKCPGLLVPVEGLLPGTVGLGPEEALKAVVPDLFGTRTGFMEDNFSADRGRDWMWGEVSG